MGFDEDDNVDDIEKGNQKGNENKRPKIFFGLEVSDGVVYTVVVILTLIFIRQISIVLQALN